MIDSDLNQIETQIESTYKANQTLLGIFSRYTGFFVKKRFVIESLRRILCFAVYRHFNFFSIDDWATSSRFFFSV